MIENITAMTIIIGMKMLIIILIMKSTIPLALVPGALASRFHWIGSMLVDNEVSNLPHSGAMTLKEKLIVLFDVLFSGTLLFALTVQEIFLGPILFVTLESSDMLVMF